MPPKNKNYKHQISYIHRFSNNMIIVYDQNLKPMYFYQGRKSRLTMKRIKDRIKRQTNKKITWRGFDFTA